MRTGGGVFFLLVAMMHFVKWSTYVPVYTRRNVIPMNSSARMPWMNGSGAVTVFVLSRFLAYSCFLV